MDLNKMSSQDRLNLCRKYFYIGFAALPFLWLVNGVWFGLFLWRGEKSLTNGSNNGRGGRPQDGDDNRQRQPPNSISQAPDSHRENSDDTEQRKRDLKEIRRLVIYSFIGAFIWFIGMGIWITIYQTNRAAWGDFGDAISFNIPRGIP